MIQLHVPDAFCAVLSFKCFTCWALCINNSNNNNYTQWRTAVNQIDMTSEACRVGQMGRWCKDGKKGRP